MARVLSMLASPKRRAAAAAQANNRAEENKKAQTRRSMKAMESSAPRKLVSAFPGAKRLRKYVLDKDAEKPKRASGVRKNHHKPKISGFVQACF